MRRLIILAACGAVILLVVLFGHEQFNLQQLARHREWLLDCVERHYAVTLAAFLLVYGLAVGVSFPGATILTMTGGFLFGWLVGGIVAVAGATLGASLVFLLARTAVGDWLLGCCGERAQALADDLRTDAWSYLLFLRLVPIFPFWLVNLAAAFVAVPLATFLATTAIGIIPGTFAFAFVGDGLDSMMAAQEAAFRDCVLSGRSDCEMRFDVRSALTPQIVVALVVLGVLALVPVLVRRWRRRHAASVSS